MALSLKTVQTSRGTRWIADAFRLFARKPLAFTMLFAVFLFGALLVSLVPLLGSIVQMMALPILSLGFMVAGQSVLLGGAAHPRHFIEPLQGDPGRRRSLLILCAIYGISAVVILLVADHVSGNAWGRLQALMAKSQEGGAAQAQIDALLSEPGVGTGVMLAVLLGTALSVPFWHAPALVHWGGQSWGQALFSSTLAVWRCKGAFFLYGLGWAGVVMAFALLSALVFGLLGLGQAAGVLAVPAGLVFSAVFYLSVLFTFNDSFGVAVVAPDTIGEDPPAAAP
jgi:hypothetical protein